MQAQLGGVKFSRFDRDQAPPARLPTILSQIAWSSRSPYLTIRNTPLHNVLLSCKRGISHVNGVDGNFSETVPRAWHGRDLDPVVRGAGRWIGRHPGPRRRAAATRLIWASSPPLPSCRPSPGGPADTPPDRRCAISQGLRQPMGPIGPVPMGSAPNRDHAASASNMLKASLSQVAWQ